MIHKAKFGFPVRLCSRAGLRKRRVKKISANPVVDVLAADAMEGIVVDAVVDVPAAGATEAIAVDAVVIVGVAATVIVAGETSS